MRPCCRICSLTVLILELHGFLLLKLLVLMLLELLRWLLLLLQLLLQLQVFVQLLVLLRKQRGLQFLLLAPGFEVVERKSHALGVPGLVHALLQVG